MGNSQISVFSRGNGSEAKEDKSILSLSSNPPKIISIKLTEIEKTLQLDLLSSNLSFQEFRKEFEREINLPLDTEIRYYTINSLTSEVEYIEDDYLLSNITKEINMEIHKNSTHSKPIDLTLTIMKDGNIEVLSVKTLSFLPLKHTLGFLFKTEDCFRIFKAFDTLLSDPLDLDKSLLEYKMTEETENMIVYYPTEADAVKAVILNSTKGIINIFEVDKYLRISQLTESYNKEANGFYVLCHPESGLKFYENYTLETVAKEQKSISMVAQDFEEYYSKSMEPVRQNPLEKEDVQTNILELPD